MREILERIESTNSLLVKASMIKEVEINEKIIVENVAKYFNQDPEAIRSSCRKKEVLIPRYCAQAFIFMSVKKQKNNGEIKNITLKETGRYFSSRDHSTVINGMNKLSDMVYTDSIDRENVEKLLSYLHGKGLCREINIGRIININNSSNF
jgi:chromosomal replication initiation ATPase DnaA